MSRVDRLPACGHQILAIPTIRRIAYPIKSRPSACASRTAKSDAPTPPSELPSRRLCDISAASLRHGRFRMSGMAKWLPVLGIAIVLAGLFAIAHFVAKFW
jgi:hypothetical protein